MNFPPETKDRDELLKKWQHVLDATDHIRSWTSGHELAWLCELAMRCESICEIGSYHGKSALCMALANPDVKLLCLDNGENAEVKETFSKNLSDPMIEGRVHLLISTSVRLKTYTGTFCGAFIDAGHTKAEVLEDILNILPHLHSGAVLCGHDWRGTDDGVNQAVIELLGQPDGVFESIWFFIIR